MGFADFAGGLLGGGGNGANDAFGFNPIVIPGTGQQPQVLDTNLGTEEPGPEAGDASGISSVLNNLIKAALAGFTIFEKAELAEKGKTLPKPKQRQPVPGEEEEAAGLSVTTIVVLIVVALLVLGGIFLIVRFAR